MLNKEKKNVADTTDFEFFFLGWNIEKKSTVCLVKFEFPINNNTLTKKTQNQPTNSKRKERKTCVRFIIYKLKMFDFISKEFQSRNRSFIFNLYAVLG